MSARLPEATGDNLALRLQERIKELETRLDEIHLHTRVLLDIAKTLNASLDPQVIANNIISALVSLIAIDQASVFLYDEQAETFQVIGLFDSGMLRPEMPAPDFTLPQRVLLDGKTYVNSTRETDSVWVCCLPMISAQRKIGTINIHRIRQAAITSEHVEFLETIAGHATLALQNAILYAIVERESITDGLTGVYNHRYFQKRLREYISLCQRRKRHASLGLLMIDVDYFKIFNDRYGHQFGDQVLKHVVQTVVKNLRAEDLLARYGGEEFVLLVPDATEKVLTLISEKIRNLVESTTVIYSRTGEHVSITVSIGVTLWHPADTPATLLARADQALYRAKSSGRNQSVFL